LIKLCPAIQFLVSLKILLSMCADRSRDLQAVVVLDGTYIYSEKLELQVPKEII
jgi:hypothetical protein